MGHARLRGVIQRLRTRGVTRCAGRGWIPVDRARRLAGLIPGARLELIQAAGHLIQLDQPVALASTLHRWLGGIARP